MLKIGILDDINTESTKELLQDLISGTPFEICRDIRQPMDILIVNKVTRSASHSPANLSPKVIIANSDDKDVLQFIAVMEAQIITYGLNPRAAVTASSHADDSYVVCAIQRAMTSIYNEPIMPQEFSVDIKNHGKFDERVIGAVAAALICGVNFE